MKNNSTHATEALLAKAQPFDNNSVENFDKQEFDDVLEKLNQVKYSPSKSTLDKVLNYAKKN